MSPRRRRRDVAATTPPRRRRDDAAPRYWWKAPWAYFGERPDVDTFWMDDGARTSRFAPLYPNTGYYLIRYNPRTSLLCETLVGMYDVVLAWQSHQAVVSQVLGEFHAPRGRGASF